MDEKSIFEKISSREIPADIVYEDELCMCFQDIEPQAPVHALLVPKKRIHRIGLAQPSDAEVLGHLMIKVPEITKKLGITESGFRLVINNGKDGGETVPHLHVHILGGRPLLWPPG